MTAFLICIPVLHAVLVSILLVHLKNGAFGHARDGQRWDRSEAAA